MLLWSLPVLRHLAIWTHKVRFEAGVNQLNLEKVKGALLASPGWGEIPTGPFQRDEFLDTGIFPPHTSLQPFSTLLNTDSSTFFFSFYFFPHLLYLKIICLPGSKTIDTLWSLHQSLFLTWSLTLFCWAQDLSLGSLTKDTVCTHTFLLPTVLNSTPGSKLFLRLSLHQEPSERQEKWFHLAQSPCITTFKGTELDRDFICVNNNNKNNRPVCEVLK